MTALSLEAPQKDQVLAKAVIRAAEQLGLKQQELADTIGLHRTAISRLKNHGKLDPNSKSGELALLLIRISRSLYALAGGDQDWMQHFMACPNKMTGGTPKEQIKQIQGLMRVLQFVDAIRGKI